MGKNDQWHVKGGVCVNEDETEFFFRDEYSATPEGLYKYIDSHYLSSNHQIREFFVGVCAQKASFDSKVATPAWQDIEFNSNGTATCRGEKIAPSYAKYFRRVKAFFDAGIDPYKIWFAYLRKRKISPWVSMRMNDVHNAKNENDALHSDFWRKHPEWRIAPHRYLMHGQQLDYGIAEVRKYNLRIIYELLDRYDVDGIELDWSRFGQVFAPGHEINNIPLLTDFIRKVRQKIISVEKKKGKSIRLCVRVAVNPVNAFNLGYDVVTWAREGLVDMVVPTTFFGTSCHNIPIRIWRALLGDDILIAPGLECIHMPFHGIDHKMFYDASITVALAIQYLKQGADRIYLYNHYGVRHEQMSTVGSLETLLPTQRRHAILFDNTPCEGEKVQEYLPLKFSPGCPVEQSFRIDVGEPPEKGRRTQFIMGNLYGFPKEEFANVRINGKQVNLSRNIPKIDFGPYADKVAAFDIPYGTLNAEGNIVEIVNKSNKTWSIRWAEIFIKGKR